MADHNEDTSWLATSELRIEDLVDLDLYDHSESSREIQAPHIRAYDELMLERRATRVGAHEEHPPLTILTKSGRISSSARYIEHVDFLPEYPRTDSDGYAYIVYLDTSDPEKLRTKEVHDRMRDIQYCKKVVGTSQVVYSSYLNYQTLRTDLRCTGAKVCQYLGSQLRDFQHSHVNEELWDSIQETRASIEDARTLTHSQRQAIALVDAAKKRFAQRKACRSHTQTCHLVFREGRPDIHGVITYFLACIHGRFAVRDHYYLPIMKEGVDFEYMRQLCTNTAEFAYEDCAVVEQQVSRKTTCGQVHPQGEAQLVRTECEVRFKIFQPINLLENPFVIFLSSGIHCHIPPPPSRPPRSILGEVLELIKRMQSPDLTTSLFLRSPELRDFCKSYRGETLSQIHASFANYDRIRALILKQRILAYPEGRDLKGVYWKYTNDPEWREYTRGIYNVPYNDGVIILCALDSQIKLLASVKSFEVDMSYKRTKGEFNEVIFAMFHEKHGKVITLARAFVNRQDKYTYKKLFEVLFERVETVTGFPIRFYYLHSEGLRAIVMDMDQGQFVGLGLYLQRRDPENREWTWQLRNIILFCHIHFKRTVRKMVPSEFGRVHSSGQTRLNSLLTSPTSEEYFELINVIKELEPRFFDWAEHKAHEFWDEVQNSTNAVEQSHNKSYSMGKYETLLGAIQGSRILDQRDMDQYTARERHDLRHGYRSADIRSRYANHMTNELRYTARQEQQLQASLEERNEQQHQILERSSSSGFFSIITISTKSIIHFNNPAAKFTSAFYRITFFTA
ncbi:uncharacterized protein N7473_008568 [Penicillium subrubescens]|uniref:uncharacterized protein n=1 Tax=Penicillium subrubescens TaxID=1316194 RepID=UPI00254569AB|nr:uncharacterized protein N7473_008568 [Penicillium subrubescens]KAJ5885894.1 hypothetical protein N7473_008568 [Penicillium subrubescens]